MLNKIMYICTILFALVMLSGCATMALEKMVGDKGSVEYLSKVYEVNASRDVVFETSISVLDNRNIEISSQDKEKGEISTPYEDKRVGFQKSLGSLSTGKSACEEALFIEISKIDNKSTRLEIGVRAKETDIFGNTKQFKYGGPLKIAVPFYYKIKSIAEEIIQKSEGR